ncbi:MAG: hypothetical protein AAF512_25450, partial [Pseudomonadota bacterium]
LVELTNSTLSTLAKTTTAIAAAGKAVSGLAEVFKGNKYADIVSDVVDNGLLKMDEAPLLADGQTIVGLL